MPPSASRMASTAGTHQPPSRSFHTRSRSSSDGREHAFRTGASMTATTRKARRRRPRITWPVVGFLAPAVLIYTVFMVVPLFDSLRRSMFAADGSFAGVDNYARLLGDQ